MTRPGCSLDVSPPRILHFDLIGWHKHMEFESLGLRQQHVTLLEYARRLPDCCSGNSNDIPWRHRTSSEWQIWTLTDVPTIWSWNCQNSAEFRLFCQPSHDANTNTSVDDGFNGIGICRGSVDGFRERGNNKGTPGQCRGVPLDDDNDNTYVYVVLSSSHWKRGTYEHFLFSISGRVYTSFSCKCGVLMYPEISFFGSKRRYLGVS